MLDISRMEGYGVHTTVKKNGVSITKMIATPNYCRGCYIWSISCWGARKDICNADIEITDPDIFEKIKVVVHKNLNK